MLPGMRADFLSLERFKKYCSHSGRGRWRAVLLGFGVVSAPSQGFQTCSVAEALPKPKNPRSERPHNFLKRSKQEFLTGQEKLTSSPARCGGYSYATASHRDGFHSITMDFGDGCINIHGYLLRDGRVCFSGQRELWSSVSEEELSRLFLGGAIGLEEGYLVQGGQGSS